MNLHSLIAERDAALADLRSQLRASEAECERLRREVEEWKENASKACETPVDGCDCSGCSYARECAAVEYLEKKEKADV